ncbi:MAG: molybdopterin-binding protein [Hyphomicrobiaceae bacterium]
MTASPARQERITAAVLVIGDEILSGRTKDQNIGTIASHLTALGIDLKEVRVVADDEADIVNALNALRARYTYVFTTGGIGPTHDDITADAVAKAFGVSIAIHPEARALMQENCDRRGIELTASRLRMARIPEGGKLVRNTVSVAPGFWIGNVIVMAGVPSIMRVMLDDVTQHLERGTPMLSRTIEVLHPEGAIADLFRRHAADYPDVVMGSYPQNTDGRYWTQLVLRSTDAERLDVAAATLKATLAERHLTAN